MKTALLLTTCLLSCYVQAEQYQFMLSADNHRVGTATMTVQKLDQNARQIAVVMHLSYQGQDATMRQESIYDGTGKQKRLIVEVVVGKSSRKLQVAEFNASGCTVTTTENGKRSVATYPVSPKAPLENPSIFWLDTVQPKNGEKAVFYSFQMSTLEWRLSESIYKGETTANLDGTKVRAFKISTPRGDVLVDAKGVPLVMVSPEITMTRILTAPNPNPESNRP